MGSCNLCNNPVHLRLKDNKAWVTIFLSLEIKGLGNSNTLIVFIIESLLKFCHSGAELNLLLSDWEKSIYILQFSYLQKKSTEYKNRFCIK